MFKFIKNLSRESTTKKLRKRCKVITAEKNTSNTKNQTSLHDEYPAVYKLFNNLKRKTKLNKASLRIKDMNRINASLFLPTSGISLTTYDIKRLPSSDISALLGHEFGHLYAHTHNIEHVVSMKSINAIVICSLLLMFFENLTGMYQTIADFITTAFMCIFIIWDTIQSSRGDECFADNYGARLLGRNVMIYMIKDISNYQKNQLNISYQRMKQLKSVPLAYFICKILYAYDKFHDWCTTKNFCTHPTSKRRVQLLSNDKSFKKIADISKHHKGNKNNNKHYSGQSIIVNIYTAFFHRAMPKRLYTIILVIIDTIIYLLLISTVVVNKSDSISLQCWYIFCLTILCFQKLWMHNIYIFVNLKLLLKIHYLKTFYYRIAIKKYDRMIFIMNVLSLFFMLVIVYSVLDIVMSILMQSIHISIHL